VHKAYFEELNPHVLSIIKKEPMNIMIMNRTEILRKEREKVLINIAENPGNRAKWLTALMDIDDEMEEMAENKQKAN